MLVKLFLPICVLIPLTSADYSMVVFWGQPTNFTNATVVSTASWDTCFSACLDSVFCVMAHGTADFCHHYKFGTVYQAEQLTSENGSKIAVKSTQTTCPSSPQSTVEVDIQDPAASYTIYSSTVTYDGEKWEFSYSVKRYCPPGWAVFPRFNQDYCLQVFLNFKTFYAYANASSECVNTHNGVMTGFETDEERLWALNTIMENIGNETATNTVAVWISGVRKTSCQTAASEGTAACAGVDAFVFSDPYLDTKGGYLWGPAQPSSYTQDCILQWAQKPGFQNISYHGLVDDASCKYTHDSFASRRGYVCGKLPGI